MKRINSKCKAFYLSLFALLIFVNSTIVQAYFTDSSKDILILNSYHKGLSWTDNETEGILDILKAYHTSSNIYVEYMDWKNYPTSENLKQLYDEFKYKYSKKQLDVIITTDDAALEFAIKNRNDLFSGAPIVFCGVNTEGIEKLGKGYSKVTGVTEITDPQNTIMAAMKINPELREVYVLFDNTESGMSTGAMTIKTINSINPDIKAKTLNHMSMKEILAEVAKAPDNSIVLITTYYMDAYGLVTGFEDFSRKVSLHSRVPVYHLYDFGLNNGAIGGSMLLGRLQGEGAGKMAVRILQGEDASLIPIENSKTTEYMFDYLQLERFDILLKKLPEGSKIINKPFSFFEHYKFYVLIATGIFSVLLTLIILLVIYIGKLSRTKRELEKKHQELSESDNKLKLQYDEILNVQQNLISSENRYALLFEKMLNGFFVFEPVMNQAGKIIDIRFLNINPGFKVQIDVNTDDIIGKTWMEVFNYPNQNLKTYHHILLTGESKHFETYYSSTGIYYMVNAFKISENQVGVVFDNITVYKKAISEITQLNEDLEQRVIERTEELQSVVNELEAFTYTVSHDLKSPLRAVDGYSRIILEDLGSKLGEDGTQMIQHIRNICKDMIEMINKLLKYSTTSKAVIVKEDINIEEVFETIFSELVSSSPGRNIKFTVETGMPKVYADRVMIRQAIYNMLSNAVKFTIHKEIAQIDVGCTITGEEYVFYIKDNGVGFDMDFSNKLFGIFQRLHGNDEFEGSGIGLVTVKKIIQKHGGQVWIEGKLGVGATIYFTLPFKE